MILPGFHKALAVMRKHTSLSLRMATFTLQLPNFRAHKAERCKNPQMVSNTPLFVNKKLRRSINRHKTWKAAQDGNRKKCFYFLSLWRKGICRASTFWLLVVWYHHFSVHTPDIQYLAVTSNKVREKHVNLIIYLPLRSNLT